MSGHEYRVRWRRADDADDADDFLPVVRRTARFKIYQKRRDAERWMAILEGKVLEYDGVDPDDYVCCAGGGAGPFGDGGCDCGGITQAERIAERMANVPPLVEGPALQVRDVGEWREADG